LTIGCGNSTPSRLLEKSGISGMAQLILISIAGFLAIVMTLIVAHEFGHYLAARWLGIIPKTFSVGMGPEITGFTDRHGTRWKISALPIGGFVKFRGAMHPSEADREPNDFASLPKWKRSIIVSAGPLINVVIACVAFLALATFYGYKDVSPVIQNVVPDSPAAQAGLEPGDRIMAWQGLPDPHMRKLVRDVLVNPGKTHHITVGRDDQLFETSFIAEEREFADQFGNKDVIGYSGLKFEVIDRKIENFDDAFDASVVETTNLFILQAQTTFQILTGERSLASLRGPFQMAKMSGEQLQLGWQQFVWFGAMVSLAIAFMNILPIPGLDGGYLALYAYESISRVDLSAAALSRVMAVGFFAIAILMGIAAFNDITMMSG
jgi:regulator of sigma E protease